MRTPKRPSRRCGRWSRACGTSARSAAPRPTEPVALLDRPRVAPVSAVDSGARVACADARAPRPPLDARLRAGSSRAFPGRRRRRSPSASGLPQGAAPEAGARIAKELAADRTPRSPSSRPSSATLTISRRPRPPSSRRTRQRLRELQEKRAALGGAASDLLRRRLARSGPVAGPRELRLLPRGPLVQRARARPDRALLRRGSDFAHDRSRGRGSARRLREKRPPLGGARGPGPLPHARPARRGG